ncbi:MULTISPECIES: head-tail connector protein [unclassified Sporosarcina]|uniref:head-tail connector protein n=1 Tax=unclassified Sporosarcina TaxID=2647733 RepID=UPI00203F70D5|nr:MULTISPECIES: head-tail connector protein [unclassified Sporosarcina]GKV67467.1 hypothetical protein NCCP2331_36200 [Sporosarcina sp. NCCP-2331]GLB57834.1 hypothetical protein NCCP2378_36280 [Sporosarcina sp. NCCP-2378]
MDLELLKKHLRVDHSFEDDLIVEYRMWAEEEIKDSVSTEPLRNEEFFKDNPHFNLAVALQTAFYYENRLGISERRLNNAINAPNAVLSAIQKLRGNYYSLPVVIEVSL